MVRGLVTVADGTIVINTELRTDKLKNKLDKLNNDIERQANKVHDLQLEYDRLNDALTDARMAGSMVNPEDAENAERARLELERAQIQLNQMQTNAAGTTEQLRQMQGQQGTSGLQNNIEGASKSLEKFQKKITTIAKKVFVFTLISSALRKVKAYMGEALEANTAYQNSLAQLRGTLRTAFQPILNVVIPILQALINILNTAMSYVAKFTSWLFGTTVSASAAAAKALYNQANATEAAGNAAAKAKRQMSGLDEMNTYQTDTGSSAGGSSAGTNVDFSAVNGVKDAMSDLEVYISGALLALGAILAFSGVSIPLGIALMAIGAAGLASALSLDWDTMPDHVRSALTATLVVIGAASLAIGVILAFSSPAHLALGIGLIVAGAAALGTAMALNWDTLKEKISGETAVLMGIIGAALLVLGMILAACGALPLGIALIAAGAVGLVTPIALNWDALKDKISQAWEKIKRWFKTNVAPKFTKKFWLEKFSTISDGLKQKIKDGINAAITLFNKFISWINDKLNIKWSSVKIAGLEVIPKGSFQLLKLNSIPMLAQGGVIPANNEFLAVLGDQKRGNNIEAPESLIRQIVREESGNGTYTFVAQLDGRTLFKEVISQGKLSRRMSGKNEFALGGG